MQNVHVALGFCIKTSADCSVRWRPGSEAQKRLRPQGGKEAGPLQPPRGGGTTSGPKNRARTWPADA